MSERVDVLLVEDNEMNADMLSRRLARRGYAVRVARHGREAMAMAGGETPDLVLMDLSLPEIDGWELTRLLRADPAMADVPILALTAHALAEDRQKALDAGCDDYDTKPVDLKRLLAKMEALLSRPRRSPPA